MKYLTVAEVRFIGDLNTLQDRVCALEDALLDLEDVDSAITDPDMAANLTAGRVDVQMNVTAEDPAEAATKALCTIRTAIHAIGDATPGWETASAVMHVAPADSADRLSV
jgi:hypothetical protein